MARWRMIAFSVLVALGASLAGAPAARAEAGVVPVQWQPERQYYAPRQYYRPAPRRRQVCRVVNTRTFVGYDRYGRSIYRVQPRRVCSWRYY
jgi:hypothetical protein